MASKHALAVRGDRIVAKSALVRQQRDMAKVAHQAIREYLLAVRRAMSHTRITAAAPIEPEGDPYGLNLDEFGPDVDLNALDQAATWAEILDNTIIPQLDELLLGIGPQGDLSPAVASQINAWRAQWMSDRRQKLLGVPDQITRQIRDAIQADADENGPDPSAAARIVTDLMNPDAPTWRSRAQTIARTEVVGANNQGGLASWTAVHESLQPVGGTVYKTWLATSDSKTRPDHAEIDGTEISMGDTFTVGGQEMNGPGDSGADADELINCRCTLTYRVEDGSDAGDTLDEQAATDAADAAADDGAVDDALTSAAAVNGDVPTGVAVMAMLSAEDAARCAAEGGEDPTNLHVTLAYLASDAVDYTDDQKASIVTGLSRSASSMPITADAFATAQFNPASDERDPCAVLLVQSDELAKLHDDIGDELAVALVDQSTTFPIWIPHVAIAYNAAPTDVIDNAALGDLTFDRLVLGWGGDHIDLGQPIAPSEAPVTAAASTAEPDAAPATAPAAEPPAVTPGAMQWEGVLAVLDTPSSDRRMILSAGFTIRDLPLPLKYQAQGEHGGEMAGKTEIVGRILTAEVRGIEVWGTGDFFDPAFSYSSSYAMQQVSAGIGCVSLDMPCTVAEYVPGPDGALLPINWATYLGDGEDIIQVAETSELAAATIVDVPAFADARITLVADPSMPNFDAVTADAATPGGPVLTEDSITFPDGTVLQVGDQVNIVDAANPDNPETTGLIEVIDPATNQVTVAVEDPDNPGQTNSVVTDAGSLEIVGSIDNETTAASGTPAMGDLTAAGFQEQHVFPAEWFEPVALDGPTALTVLDDGRVYGHLAAFGTCHTGFGDQCVSPPTSPSGYAFFHVGEVETSSGPLPVGKLTVGGGHATLKAGWRGAAEHYDNAGAAVAVVRAHEDAHGIQVSGAILPTATKEQVAALRRSPLSGDWRPIGGRRELVAALSVNVPGFPVPRAALAADGRPLALVAAGVIRAPAGHGEPPPAVVTLPSGVTLTPEDVAILASAFADISEQRTKAAADRDRSRDARTLRSKLIRDRLLRAVP